jgi:predicted permease
LARATARSAEIGVRLALGAGRSRLIRQLLTESLVLAALGTLAAIPLAGWGTRALIGLASQESWRLPVRYGWHAFEFTLAIAAAAVCLFGLIPALAATRLDVHSALQAGRGAVAGTRARLGRALIAAQIAIALVMLSCASLFMQSLWNLRHQDFGFDAAHVISADLPLEFTRGMRERHTALRGPLFDAANAIPGVRSAAVSGFGILGAMQHTVNASTPDRPAGKDDFVRAVHVSDRYFETLGLPIVVGRGTGSDDLANSPPVAVVSQTAARLLFGGANPVGRYISESSPYNAKSARLVVGVAQDVPFASARDPFGAIIYIPLAQGPVPITAVLVRPAGDPRTIAGSLRSTIARIDQNLRVGEIRPLQQILESGLGTDRTLAILSASLGALALGLTSIGVYGVIAYAVRRRTREIGLRIALGAARPDVTRLLLAGVLRLLVAGLAVGAIGAWFTMRAMRSSLFGIAASDLTIPIAAAVLLTAVALLAAWLPARRAARLDPMNALRQE